MKPYQTASLDSMIIRLDQQYETAPSHDGLQNIGNAQPGVCLYVFCLFLSEYFVECLSFFLFIFSSEAAAQSSAL